LGLRLRLRVLFPGLNSRSCGGPAAAGGAGNTYPVPLHVGQPVIIPAHGLIFPVPTQREQLTGTA